MKPYKTIAHAIEAWCADTSLNFQQGETVECGNGVVCVRGRITAVVMADGTILTPHYCYESERKVVREINKHYANTRVVNNDQILSTELFTHLSAVPVEQRTQELIDGLKDKQTAIGQSAEFHRHILKEAAFLAPTTEEYVLNYFKEHQTTTRAGLQKQSFPIVNDRETLIKSIVERLTREGLRAAGTHDHCGYRRVEVPPVEAIGVAYRTCESPYIKELLLEVRMRLAAQGDQQ